MRKLLWLLYGAFLSSVIIYGLGELLNKDSAFHNFYTILIAFDKRYLLLLILNIIAFLTDILAPLVVVFFAMNIKTCRRFWQILFWVRAFFGVFGHFYDLQYVKASFYQSRTYGIACLVVFTAPLLPSYLAHYLYAFKNTNKK